MYIADSFMWKLIGTAKCCRLYVSITGAREVTKVYFASFNVNNYMMKI